MVLQTRNKLLRAVAQAPPGTGAGEGLFRGYLGYGAGVIGGACLPYVF